MVEARVIDTNVLIVASAADGGSPFCLEDTPVTENQLRQQILDWLIAFEQDSLRHTVLDNSWTICEEYQNKLNVEQDYGWLAMMAKMDRSEVVWVDFPTDSGGHAVLPKNLAIAVTDLADRKMVAAVLEAQKQVTLCKLTNVCDTDWFDCADALSDYGVEVEQLLGDWLLQKWEAKRKRK